MGNPRYVSDSEISEHRQHGKLEDLRPHDICKFIADEWKPGAKTEAFAKSTDAQEDASKRQNPSESIEHRPRQ